MEYFIYVRSVGQKNGRYDVTEGRYFLDERPDETSWPYFELQAECYRETQGVFQRDFGYFPEDTGLGIFPFIEGADNVEVSWP